MTNLQVFTKHSFCLPSSSSSGSSDDDETETGAVKIKQEVDETPEENSDDRDEVRDPPETENEADSVPIKKESEDSDRELMPPPTTPVSKPKLETQISEKQIRKPLAAMLPEKYQGIDVRTLFPEFRPGQVLRFSRLFPIKPSLRPRIWKNVKRRLKKKVDGADEDESKEKKAKSGENNFLKKL